LSKEQCKFVPRKQIYSYKAVLKPATCFGELGTHHEVVANLRLQIRICSCKYSPFYVLCIRLDNGYL